LVEPYGGVFQPNVLRGRLLSAAATAASASSFAMHMLARHQGRNLQALMTKAFKDVLL
jgi:hypothetical protein